MLFHVRFTTIFGPISVLPATCNTLITVQCC